MNSRLDITRASLQGYNNKQFSKDSFMPSTDKIQAMKVKNAFRNAYGGVEQKEYINGFMNYLPQYDPDW